MALMHTALKARLTTKPSKPLLFTPFLLCLMCQMFGVRCQVSGVRCNFVIYFFFVLSDKVVSLVCKKTPVWQSTGSMIINSGSLNKIVVQG